jgi:hypothetical protein
MLERSEMARELKAIYVGLSEQGWLDMSINRRVRLSLSLQHPALHPTGPLRPYRTLLPFDGVEALGADASVQLRRLLDFALRFAPHASFENMASELNLPIQEVFRLAAHLVYWRKGRVVDAVHPHNVYRVSATANLDPTSPLHFEFQCRFGRRVRGAAPTSAATATTAGIGVAPAAGLPGVLKKHDADSAPLASAGQSSGGGGGGKQARLEQEQAEDGDRSGWRLASFAPEQQRRPRLPSPTRAYTGKATSPRVGPASASASPPQLLLPPSASQGKPQGAPQEQQEQQQQQRQEEEQQQRRQQQQRQSEMPTLSLVRMLEIFSSGARPPQLAELKALARGRYDVGTQEFHAILTWLLRHELVEQLHKYFYLVVPDALARRAELAAAAGDDAANASALASPEALDPDDDPCPQHLHQQPLAPPTRRHEQALLDALATDTATYRLLRRLAPYLHGRHHMTEIMWRENVTRDAMDKLLAAYGDVLFAYWHA